MKKYLPAFFLLFIFFSSVAYSQTDALQGQQLYNSNFTIDSISRNITYYMPLNYGKKEVYPLIIFLHVANSSSKNFIKTYGDMIQSKADSLDCMIMYPDAVDGHWNDKISGSFPATDSINDVGFLTIMIDYFVQVYHADRQRIYVTGFENGGFMAKRLSCDIPLKITAIAAFAKMPDIANTCNTNASVAVMDTQKIPSQLLQKPDRKTIYEAMDFLLKQIKN